MTSPILYTFRRCPYAMRARLAIAASTVKVELREIILKNKPAAMLEASPKGTVPVLLDTDGTVVDESLDIMHWALKQSDPEGWLDISYYESCMQLIGQNDTAFKPWLDRYKYADRHPEHPMSYYRDQCADWLSELDHKIASNGGGLLASHYVLADYALFPFVRQCAHVDKAWFNTQPWPALQQWLTHHLESDLFSTIMHKYQPWEAGTQGVMFPEMS